MRQGAAGSRRTRAAAIGLVHRGGTQCGLTASPRRDHAGEKRRVRSRMSEDWPPAASAVTLRIGVGIAAVPGHPAGR
ncbi:hypothetical protein EGK76_06110 [Luteimonas sp. 100069]|nr:hypothetical protein EGK76_06110 [Luteimonas sp. 100069]